MLLIKEIFFKNIFIKSFIQKTRYKASITVEASLAFSLTLFALFLCLGPMFIIKTNKDMMLLIDNQSKMVSYYEMLKQNFEENKENVDYSKLSNDSLNDEIYVNDEETKNKDTFFSNITESLFNLFNYEMIFIKTKNKYNDDNNNAYNNLHMILPYNFDVFNDETKIIKYDLYAFFKLPFNLFNVNDVNQRFVNLRRAFVGVDGDRYNEVVSESDKSDKVYLARNHIYSHIYHEDRYCTYLEKKTTQITYNDLNTKKTETGNKYLPCDYCMKNIHLSNDSNIYITKYGDKYHYLEKCPMMTAIVSESSIDEAIEKGLTACSKCRREQNDN